MSIQSIHFLENKYAEKKCAFLASGPSLGEFDLNSIKSDIITFGYQSLIPFCFDFWDSLRLDFYMCHDPSVMHFPFKRGKEVIGEHFKFYDGYLNLPILSKYQSVSPANFMLNSPLMKNSGLIFSSNISYVHDKRFNLPNHPQWVKDNERLLEKRSVFTYEMKGDHIDVPSSKACKNSFCSVTLPLLLYMGFKEIYLLGVDYSNNGDFFCKIKNKEGYIPREFKEFQNLMAFSETLKSRPKIFSVKSDNVKVVAKDGFIDFSNISN